jgi:hypothetical protein
MTYSDCPPVTVGGASPQVDDLVVIPRSGVGKERSDVHPIASIVVADHINDLLAESTADRLARSARTPKAQRTIVSRLGSVWSAISGAANGPAALPKLTDYPFRS